jgi:hypothetical protein
MGSYTPENTANQGSASLRRSAYRRGCLKNQVRARVAHEFIFAIALNIGFFLCYFRRRVVIVGRLSPAFAKHQQEIQYGEKECSTDQV